MRHTLAIVGICLAAGLLGCRSSREEQYALQTDATLTRELYEPLLEGQEEILESFGEARAQLRCFHATAEGAKLLEDAPPAHELWNETVITFVVPDDRDAPTSETAYFNPRELRLKSLYEESVATDVLALPDGGVGIYRTLAWRPKGLGPVRRAIFRFDFAPDAQGWPVAIGHRRVTPDHDGNLLAVPVPNHDLLVYLRQDLERPRQVNDAQQPFNELIVADANGDDARPLFPGQSFNIQRLAVDRIGRLYFAADPEGVYRIYHYDFEHERMSQADSFPRPREDQCRLILGTSYRNGTVRPVITRIPDRLDLDGVCALVKAHNPSVNNFRALWVAAMIEAKMVRLAHWPTVNWSVSYTPVVGVFVNQVEETSGDFLSEGIARGIVGLAQPLLEFERVEDLHRAARHRVQIARHTMEDELNERLAEAAMMYFEAQHLRRRLAVNEALIANITARRDYYEERRMEQEALRTQVLAAGNVLVGVKSEDRFHRERLRFVTNRLRHLCGLSERMTFELTDEQFRFEGYPTPDIDKLRQFTILNHPRLHGATALLPEAFNIGLSGPEIRPNANFQANYGHSRDAHNGFEAVDDYISLVLSGQWPTATKRARELYNERWKHLQRALEIEQQRQVRVLMDTVSEARLDFVAAQHDYQAKLASHDYFLERLRTERLYAQYGPRFPDQVAGPMTVNEAQFEYLGTLANLLKVKMDLGLRFCILQRDLGLARRIPQEAAMWREDIASRNQAAVWLWNPADIADSDAHIGRFLDVAETWRLRRVYCYLGEQAEVLTDEQGRQRMTILINACDRRGIEVWGLLGDDRWLEGAADGAAMRAAIENVTQFNGRRAFGEPRLAGVKLVLRPYLNADWHRDPRQRHALNAAYLRLLAMAREQLAGTPLWTDAPVLFYRSGHRRLLRAIEQRVDGISALCYADSPEQARALANEVMGTTNIPVEIALELSPNARADESMTALKNQTVRRLADHVSGQYEEARHFVGVAWHHYEALAARTEESEQ